VIGANSRLRQGRTQRPHHPGAGGQAGATNPEQLGEQLALLLDGASARNRVLNTETFATAAAIAAVLVDNAIPTAAVPPGAGGNATGIPRG
jgi:hypothetical protein